MKRHHYIIIFAVSALIRLGFVVWEWSDYYVHHENTLSSIYFYQGYGLVAGYGYVRGIGEPAHTHLWDLYRRVSNENTRVTPAMAGPLPQEGAIPEMLHPPGMALLVAGANIIFNIKADVPIQIMGIIFDSIAAVLVYWIASTAFNKRVGLLVGILYSLFPPLARGPAAKSPDGLIAVFVVGCFFCILKGARTSRWQSLGWYAASGLMLGLGSYLRPDYMLMPAFLVLGLWAYTRRLIRSLSAMVLTQMVVLLVLFPWAYRNYNLSNRWIFTSTSVGATLITGLGKFTNPWGFGHADEDRHKQAAAQGIPSAWTSEADLYFRKLFVKSVKEEPGAFFKAVLLRIPFAIATPYDWGFANPVRLQIKGGTRQAQDHRDSVLRSRLKVLNSRPLYMLAAYWDRLIIMILSVCSFISVGVLFVKEWQNRGLVFLLVAPHVYAILAHLITHMQPRFILPTMYCWLIGLGYMLAQGWRHYNSGQLLL
jgi:4-amino-4-deoxy-L-arabinose transferase-like glycosyltransferase